MGLCTSKGGVLSSDEFRDTLIIPTAYTYVLYSKYQPNAFLDLLRKILSCFVHETESMGMHICNEYYVCMNAYMAYFQLTLLHNFAFRRS